MQRNGCSRGYAGGLGAPNALSGRAVRRAHARGRQAARRASDREALRMWRYYGAIGARGLTFPGAMAAVTAGPPSEPVRRAEEGCAKAPSNP